jgi:hypothetical protein
MLRRVTEERNMSKRKDRVKRPPGKTAVCPFCGYGSKSDIEGRPILWVTRVEHPKQCPACKRYLLGPKIPGLRKMPTVSAAPGADKYIAGISGIKNL